MTTPQAFSVHRAAGAPADQWAIDDPRVEQLYLPILGPTAFCLLRHIDHELAQERDWGVYRTFRSSDVGDAIFVPPSKAYSALKRLRQFHLIDEDDIDTSYEHPVMICRGTVPPIGPKQWRRLPASVRERYAHVEL